VDSTGSSAGQLQLDEGDLIIDEMNGHETMELVVLCGAH